MHSNSGLNLGGPFEERTTVVAFDTHSDVEATQVLYEEGGTVRGFNLYIEEGFLYLNTYNLNNDDKGKTTPWKTVFTKLPVKKKTAYVAVAVYDYKANEIRLVLNEQAASAKGVGRLFDHPDPGGIGGINAGAVLHNNRVEKKVLSFKGAIAEVMVFDKAKSWQEQYELKDFLWTSYLKKK